MSEEQVKNSMRAFVKAIEARDTDKALSLCTEDATWTTPHGTFKDKGELKRYISWMNEAVADQKVTETGIKVMAHGNSGVYEHVLSGTSDGAKWEVLAVCVYEFSGDKIQNIRTVYDRLAVAKQVAKGMLATRAVDGIINRMERGLH